MRRIRTCAYDVNDILFPNSDRKSGGHGAGLWDLRWHPICLCITISHGDESSNYKASLETNEKKKTNEKWINKQKYIHICIHIYIHIVTRNIPKTKQNKINAQVRIDRSAYWVHDACKIAPGSLTCSPLPLPPSPSSIIGNNRKKLKGGKGEGG